MGTLLADIVRVTLYGKADKKIADRAIIASSARSDDISI
jgi:hypothetical protein